MREEYIEDLERSEDENSWFDGFSDVLTPVTYAKRLEKEVCGDTAPVVRILMETLGITKVNTSEMVSLSGF